MPDKPKFRKPRDADEFARGAEESPQQPEEKEVYPWEHPEVRDERKMVPLYLPERIKLKIKYISDQTGIPQQRILRDIVIPGVDYWIKKLGARSDGK